MVNTSPARPGFGFKNLSVAWKLRWMALIACVLLMVVGVVGIVQLGSAQSRLSSMYAVHLHNTKTLDEVAIAYRDARLSTRVLGMAQTKEENDAATIRVEESLAALATTWAGVEGLDIAGADADRDEIDGAFADYQQVVRDKLIPAGASNSYALFNQVVDEEVAPITNAIDESLTRLLDAEDHAAKVSTDSSASAYEPRGSC